MICNMKTTAPVSSVGADEGQPKEISSKPSVTEVRENRNRNVRSGKKEMETVTMNRLLDHTFEPRPPVIDSLLYSGTYIFVGPPKIGKSFLMAQIAWHVANGMPFWDNPVRKGTVLYLALEDDYARLQGRLSKMFGEEGTDHLHLTVRAKTLMEGLMRELEQFRLEHSDTNLIIIDTLQKIRDASGEQFSYGNDYEVMSRLKDFSDRYKVCILVVHHTRKMDSKDSFDMISGTNGIFGAADGAFVLQKKRRTDPEAVLEITGRDQPDAKLTIEFDPDRCIWSLKEREGALLKKIPDPVLMAIQEFVKEQEFCGTPSVLFSKVNTGLKQPNALTRHLNAKVNELFNDYHVLYQSERVHDGRRIRLKYLGEEA